MPGCGREKDMAKRILAVATATVCLAALLSACSTVSTTSEYMTWTKRNWDEATPSERSDAAAAVLSNVGEEMMDGYSQAVRSAHISAKADAQIRKLNAQMVGEIGAYFEVKDDATLQELVDQTKELLGGK